MLNKITLNKLGLFLAIVLVGFVQATAVATQPSFGYGFNVAAWDIGLVQSMGFNWIKLFSPPGERLPVQVLMRVEANANNLTNLDAFRNDITQLAQNHGDNIDAYEIGNEPNLDASYGWAAAPIAADYVTLLCAAYERIKAVDPTATVVSAGLAPTGRVSGNWNGHSGHNGLYQDERQFLQEMIAAGVGNCLDAVGYHPYGFSADYDAEPDGGSSDSTQNCVNGFCFRGAEKLYELMRANGLTDKPMWATEFGWLTHPPEECLDAPGWNGRLWQIVSADKQAANLVGAFEYATTNWPWMEAMFVFNLNFNQAPWYDSCEQMRYYSVADRLAESALREMEKVQPPPAVSLDVGPSAMNLFVAQAEQPTIRERWLTLSNTGSEMVDYTVTAVSDDLQINLSNHNGTLAPGATAQVQIEIESGQQPLGTYSGALNITTDPVGEEMPIVVPITLFVVEEVARDYLPLVVGK